MDPGSPTHGAARQLDGQLAIKGGIKHQQLVGGLRAEVRFQPGLEFPVHAHQIGVGIRIHVAVREGLLDTVREGRVVEAAALPGGARGRVAVRSTEAIKGQGEALHVHVRRNVGAIALGPGHGNIEAELTVEERAVEARGQAVGIRFPLAAPGLAVDKAASARVAGEGVHGQRPIRQKPGVVGDEILHPRVGCRHKAIRSEERLGRVGGRGGPLRDFHARIKRFDVEIDVFRHRVVGFHEALVGVLLLNQVVVVSELEEAGVGRQRVAEGLASGVGHAANNAKGTRIRIGHADGEDRPGVTDGGVAPLGVGTLRTHGPVEIAQANFAAALVFKGSGHVPAVVPRAEHDAGLVLAVGFFEGLARQAELGAFEVIPGDEVRDPGDGVRAIKGGGAVLQHFDPADSDGRNGADIHTDVGGGHVATAIEEHEGPGRTQAPKVNGGRPLVALTARGVELVGFADVAVRNVQVSDHLRDRGVPHVGEVLGAEHVHGKGGVLRRTADKGAGNHHLFDGFFGEYEGRC